MQAQGSMISGLGGGGYMVYDAGMPGLMGPTVVNNYTVLATPAYWRAMNFIAKNMASFPRSIRKDGIDVKHELDWILKFKPNLLTNSFNFWMTLVFHWVHYGNGFARIQRDSQVNAAALENLRPEFVAPFIWQPEGDGTEWSDRQQWYLLNGGGYREVVPAADMIHLQGLSYDGLAGYNPVFLMSETHERARSVNRFVTKFLRNGTMLRGSVEIPAGVDAKKQEAIVDLLRTKFQGPESDRDVLVLSEGAKLNNNTLSPDQSKLIDLTGYSTKQISQMTGVPMVFLMDQTEAKYNNTVEMAWDMVIRDLFRPMLVAVEDEFSTKLLTQTERMDGLSVYFDTDALTRGDTAATTNRAVQLKNAGIWTANDSRKSVGTPPSNDPEANKLQALGSTHPPAPTKDEPDETNHA